MYIEKNVDDEVLPESINKKVLNGSQGSFTLVRKEKIHRKITTRSFSNLHTYVVTFVNS